MILELSSFFLFPSFFPYLFMYLKGKGDRKGRSGGDWVKKENRRRMLLVGGLLPKWLQHLGLDYLNLEV